MKALVPTKISYPFYPFDRWQVEFLNGIRRLNAIIVHRRGGKTSLGLFFLWQKAVYSTYKNPVCTYYGVTEEIVRDTAWKQFMINLQPFVEFEAKTGIPLVKINSTHMNVLLLWKNAEIRFKTYENIYSTKGGYNDAVVMDEYQAADEDCFNDVVSPTLKDHKGEVVFMGTVKGRNQMYDIYEHAIDAKNLFEKGKTRIDEWNYNRLKTWDDTKIFDEEEKGREQRNNSQEFIEQEYMCNPDAETSDTVFSRNMTLMRETGRIVEMSVDESRSVYVSWDLGLDGLAAWFFQFYNNQIYIIDWEVVFNKDTNYALDILRDKIYNYEKQILPHDAVNRSKNNYKETSKKVFEKGGYQTIINKRPTKLLDAINAGRVLLNKSIMLKSCAEKKISVDGRKLSGFDALNLYSYKTGTKEEHHNSISHVGAALRNGALYLSRLNTVSMTAGVLKNQLKQQGFAWSRKFNSDFDLF